MRKIILLFLVVVIVVHNNIVEVIVALFIFLENVYNGLLILKLKWFLRVMFNNKIYVIVTLCIQIIVVFVYKLKLVRILSKIKLLMGLLKY